MERIERNVRSWIAHENAAEIDDIVSAISVGDATLLNVVKALGEYLTAEEDALRTKGVQFLSLVVQGVPKDKLNRQAAHVLAVFFCSKLEDTETITPALTGLSHLVKLPALSSSDVPDIVNALFTHVKMKVLVQSTRFLVFSIIHTLMTSHRAELKAMGNQFVDGYATLASGEKDPRNLMVAFAIALVILTEFDTSKHLEQYFDITFCYFPITFRPPPNDPYGISVDDLKASLQLCLSATPAFGPLGIPLFLEKLTAGSPVNKRDSLHALSACVPVYGPAVVRGFGGDIWSALKLEIFQPVDSFTENAALATLQAFVGVLQSSQALTDGAPSDIIDELVLRVCGECLEAIGEPENARAKAGMKMLCSLIGIEPNISLYATTHAVEALVKIFHDPMEVSHRAAVILLLTDLLKSLEPVDLPIPSKQSAPIASGSAVPPHLLLASSKDSLLGVLIVGLKAPSTRLPAIHGLSLLIHVPSAVTDDELGYIVLEVGEFVGKEPDEVEDITPDVLSLLSSIAVLRPQHLATQILPPLFVSLPDRAPAREAQSQRTAYWRALKALSSLCTHPALFETFVIRLTTKLDLLCSPPLTPASTSPTIQDTDETERTLAYAHAILTALANTLSTKVSKPQADPDVTKCVNTLLPHLFRLCIGAALATNQHVPTDTRLLLVVAQIVRLVVRSSPTESQNRFFGGLIPAFLDGQIKLVTGGEFASPEEFRPMDPWASARQRNTALLYAAAHVPMRREVSVGVSKLSSRLRDLVSWCSSQSCTKLQREAASQLFTSLVNKFADEISEFIAFELEDHWPAVVNNRDVAVNDRRNALVIWVSITKALLVRSHPSATAFIDKLFTLLDDHAVDIDAAQALGALAGRDEVLTKENGAILKILYAQKYFSVALPRILEGAKHVSGSRRETVYLIALASLINVVPKVLYVSQMPTLMPLFIRGLDLEDLACRADIIDTLTNTIDTASDERSPLPEYASTLVISILKNTIVTDMPDPRVRIASLKYLALLPGVIRYDVLHPYKSRVLKELGKALDDPKRAVRKEAVDARTTWFKYSG